MKLRLDQIPTGKNLVIKGTNSHGCTKNLGLEILCGVNGDLSLTNFLINAAWITRSSDFNEQCNRKITSQGNMTKLKLHKTISACMTTKNMQQSTVLEGREIHVCVCV